MVAHPTPVIPALWCRRQDDSRSSQLYNEFQASLGYKQTCLKPTKTWRGKQVQNNMWKGLTRRNCFPKSPALLIPRDSHNCAFSSPDSWVHQREGKTLEWILPVFPTSDFPLATMDTHSPIGFCLAPPPCPHEYSHLTLVDLHGFRSLCGPSLDRAFPSWCFYLFCWVWFGSLKTVSSSGPPTSATQTPGFQVCTTMSRPNGEPLQAACGVKDGPTKLP